MKKKARNVKVFRYVGGELIPEKEYKRFKSQRKLARKEMDRMNVWERAAKDFFKLW